MRYTTELIRAEIKLCALVAMKHRRESAELLVAGDTFASAVHLDIACAASEHAFQIAAKLPDLDAAVLAA